MGILDALRKRREVHVHLAPVVVQVTPSPDFADRLFKRLDMISAEQQKQIDEIRANTDIIKSVTQALDLLTEGNATIGDEIAKLREQVGNTEGMQAVAEVLQAQRDAIDQLRTVVPENTGAGANPSGGSDNGGSEQGEAQGSNGGGVEQPPTGGLEPSNQ